MSCDPRHAGVGLVRGGGAIVDREPDYEHPKIVAELDQLGAVLRDLAPHLFGFYGHLTDSGFKPHQALHLVGILFQHLLDESSRKRSE